MTTQNLEYSEDVKAFPVVKGAFDARDEEQLEVLAITEEMEKLSTQIAERQRALDRAVDRLTIADDKLAMAATMAQDQIDAIEKVKYDLKHGSYSIIDGLQETYKDGELNEDTLVQATVRFDDLFGVVTPPESELDGETPF